MNLHQLRAICQVADCDMNITRAARALHTTQPGVSKQLSSLERELGVDIVLRQGNRIVAFTAAGEAILKTARRILNDARTIQSISEDFGTQESGRLVIATTHTHARYVLADVIERFSRRYSKVQVVVRQGNAAGVVDLVSNGDADVGVSARPDEPVRDIVMLPCYELPRSIVVPAGHPLLRKRRPAIEDIAQYPLIALDASFAAGQKVLQRFSRSRLEPNIVVAATDTDVIKWYVTRGLGISVLPSVAFDAKRDRGLKAIDVAHIFEANVAYLMLRRNQYLLRHTADFASLLVPQCPRADIDRALVTGNVPTYPVAIYPKPAKH